MYIEEQNDNESEYAYWSEILHEGLSRNYLHANIEGSLGNICIEHSCLDR